MNDLVLFTARGGNTVTAEGLARSLREIGADDCDLLFIHSGLAFGAPNPALGRAGLLGAIWQVVQDLGVPTVCVPTFTFSFPNGEAYNRETSRTRMGIFNEYVRRLPEASRSLDPNMSMAVVGRDAGWIEGLGPYSCGPECAYERLHRKGEDVMFLFLGVRCYTCFTYTHFVESEVQVPFRYQRPFEGIITDGARSSTETWFHYARYHGVTATGEDKFERYLESTHRIRKQPLGDGWVSAVREPDGYQAMCECLEGDPFYLAARRYCNEELGDTRFLEKDVVAL